MKEPWSPLLTWKPWNVQKHILIYFVEATPVPHFQFCKIYIICKYLCTWMLTHPKTSTEWGTYSFSHAPTTKSGTCPCTPLQALRLCKKWFDGPLQNQEPATNLARVRFSLQNQGTQSHFFGALLWFSETLYRMRNLQFQPCSHYKIRNLSLHTLAGT